MDAVNSLGFMHENGRGVAKDDTMAVKLYRRAADGGVVLAAGNLGVTYEDGRGVARDEARAVDLYRRAADGGISTRPVIWTLCLRPVAAL